MKTLRVIVSILFLVVGGFLLSSIVRAILGFNEPIGLFLWKSYSYMAFAVPLLSFWLFAVMFTGKAILYRVFGPALMLGPFFAFSIAFRIMFWNPPEVKPPFWITTELLGTTAAVVFWFFLGSLLLSAIAVFYTVWANAITEDSNIQSEMQNIKNTLSDNYNKITSFLKTVQKDGKYIPRPTPSPVVAQQPAPVYVNNAPVQSSTPSAQPTAQNVSPQQPAPIYVQTPPAQPAPIYVQTPPAQPAPIYIKTSEAKKEESTQPAPIYIKTPEPKVVIQNQSNRKEEKSNTQAAPIYVQTPPAQPAPIYVKTPEAKKEESTQSAPIYIKTPEPKVVIQNQNNKENDNGYNRIDVSSHVKNHRASQYKPEDGMPNTGDDRYLLIFDKDKLAKDKEIKLHKELEAEGIQDYVPLGAEGYAMPHDERGEYNTVSDYEIKHTQNNNEAPNTQEFDSFEAHENDNYNDIGEFTKTESHGAYHEDVSPSYNSDNLNIENKQDENVSTDNYVQYNTESKFVQHENDEYVKYQAETVEGEDGQYIKYQPAMNNEDSEGEYIPYDENAAQYVDNAQQEYEEYLVSQDTQNNFTHNENSNADEYNYVENEVSSFNSSNEDEYNIQDYQTFDTDTEITTNIDANIDTDDENVDVSDFIKKDVDITDDVEDVEVSNFMKKNADIKDNDEQPVSNDKDSKKKLLLMKKSNGTPKTTKVKSTKRKGQYRIPVHGILEPPVEEELEDPRDAQLVGLKLEETLKEFNIESKVVSFCRGPVVTLYEILPAPGVRLSRIVSLADNIALRLAATSIRIVAPIPGKSAVGIEVPNERRSMVNLSELVTHKTFFSKENALPIALGRDISNNVKVSDLSRAPHLLIAGATGSGKSVCVNSIICSLLFRCNPDELKFVLIDPKMVELNFYNGIPHLLTPVIDNPEKSIQALKWCVEEMENRYKTLHSHGAREIRSYNSKLAAKNVPKASRMPYIVIIIDEFADLMLTCGKELETLVSRIAAKSRAVGIHLVLATQRPSTDVITGVIKANIPSRIAFMVSSKTDSRIIIDQNGADALLGKGDMLFSSAQDLSPIRIQGAFLSEEEVANVVDTVREVGGEPDYIDEEEMFPSEASVDTGMASDDPLWDEALDEVRDSGKASASHLQRRFKIGYNRAARLVDEMEDRGIVGPQQGSKPRDVFV